MKLRRVLLGSLGLVLGACAADVEDAPSDQHAQTIVRGQKELGRPQVVFLHIQRFGALTRCSGTYVAPRVVLTAAHCIRPDIVPDQFFVYHGNDYAADVALLPELPPPGTAYTPWARAESWTVHPEYSPEVSYPDLAVVYLDRELPFEPLRIHRGRVNACMGTMVGWGANRALTPDLSQVEGAGVKRSGTAWIVGTPTEADYDPADPNPGLLIPEIRADLLKVDGRAPRSNTCAGDSGGPLLLGRRGHERVAGVTFWTGLSCEGYSMYTRLDPFLPFLDEAIERAGREPIVPRLECVAEREDGELTAYFGYENANALSVTIPYHRKRNALPQDPGLRPKVFGPGDHPWVFGLDFAEGERLTYQLMPPHGPKTRLVVDASSPRCAEDDPNLLCARQCEAALAAECADGSVTFEQCQAECNYFATDLFGSCTEQFAGFLRCSAAVSADASNWSCYPGTTPSPASPNCDAELDATLACAGF